MDKIFAYQTYVEPLDKNVEERAGLLIFVIINSPLL